MASSLRRARTDDLLAAIQYMKQKEKIGYYSDPEDQTWDGESWDINQVVEYAKFKPGECIILIDGYVVNVTPYLREHVSDLLTDYTPANYFNAPTSPVALASFGRIAYEEVKLTRTNGKKAIGLLTGG